MPRYDQFVLPFGLGIAAAALLYWSAWEYETYGRIVGEGFIRATVVLGAVGVLALLMRLVHRMTDPAAEHRIPDRFDES